MTAVKLCPRCGEAKGLTLFSKNKRAADGLQVYCKPCAGAASNAAKMKNPLRYREVARQRDARFRASEHGREIKRRLARGHSARHPGKVAARKALWQAVKRGRVTRPDVCSRCRASCKPEAHHPDYARPLDVVWLCRDCHAAEHTPAAFIPTTNPSSKETTA